MNKFCFPLLALLLIACTSAITTAQEKNEDKKKMDEGWVNMFNGENLLGWHVSENHGSVYVEGNCLVTAGKRAHAFYVGPNGNTDLKNFHFKAKIKTMENANSGVYFHTEYQSSGWPDKGYEAQVNNTHKDPKKTGGLYGVQDNLKAPVKDDQWFDFEIIVKDKQIVIKVDGETVSDYTEPEDLDRPERCLTSGTFALQAHDPGSIVFYKDLMFKALPETKMKKEMKK